MTEPESTDHWAWLASTLGVEPAQQSEPGPAAPEPTPEDAEGLSGERLDEPRSVESAGGAVRRPQGTEKAAALSRSAPKPLRTREEWSALASSLGVEVPEEPPALPAPAQAAETLSEPIAPADRTAAVSEAAPEAWTESVIELMEAGPEDFGPAGETRTAREGPSQQRSDRGRGKRRRRRRPDEARVAGPASPEAAAPEAPEAWGDAPPASTASAADLPEEREQDEEPLAVDPVAAQDAMRTGRSKRRRHRRSDRRRERDLSAGRPTEAGAASDASAAGESAALEPPAGASDSGEPSLLEPAQAVGDEGLQDQGDEELQDQGDEGADEEAAGDKDGHRAIPSWEETIAVIINRNLEARARKPDAGRPPRSRGGQHRGSSDRSSWKRK